MDIMKILDEPVGEWVKDGYLFCPQCGCYEHHPFVFCPRCGIPYIREKAMTWREFIKITSHYGAGPINTVSYFLTQQLPDKNGGHGKSADGSIYWWDMNATGKIIYAEADRIYNENHNFYHGKWPEHKFCSVCGGPLKMRKNKEGKSYRSENFCSDRCADELWPILCREDDGGITRLANQLRRGQQ